MLAITLNPVGIVHSCFREKFAIPRQPALAPDARGEIELLSPYNHPDALEGLEGISHLWLTFVFHEAMPDHTAPPRLKVRPPRLGGNKKTGVFATRSTHRPNPVGLSVVKYDGVRNGRIQISGIDLLDQTPVLDIKPYIPYADSITDAVNTMAPEPPLQTEVRFSAKAMESAAHHEQRTGHPVISLIHQMLAQDPKPAYQTPSPERVYGVSIWDMNVTWRYPDPESNHIEVLDISR